MSSEQYWKCHLPSFPHRRESRGLKLQHPQKFFKYLGLDSRLRGNDRHGYFYLNPLCLSAKNAFRCSVNCHHGFGSFPCIKSTSDRKAKSSATALPTLGRSVNVFSLLRCTLSGFMFQPLVWRSSENLQSDVATCFHGQGPRYFCCRHSRLRGNDGKGISYLNLCQIQVSDLLFSDDLFPFKKVV